MMKRLGALAALLLAMGLLCGCGLLNNEYVSIKDYTPSVQEESSDDGKVTVKNFSALKQALLKMGLCRQDRGDDSLRRGLRRGHHGGHGKRLLAGAHAGRAVRILRGEHGV